MLTNPMPSAAARNGGVKHERNRAQMQRDKKAFVAQGMNNNMTMKGMKHFKNQSLTF